jgi:hypothetical protein
LGGKQQEMELTKTFTILCLVWISLLVACANSSEHAESTRAEPTEAFPILQDYPLEVGRTWVYSATFIGGGLNEEGEFEETHWSGLVTETIVSEHTVEGSMIFTATLQRGGYHWLEERVYEVTGDSIYRDGQEILRLPLEVGQEWFPFGEEWEGLLDDAAPGWYVWRVFEEGDVETSAGSFDGCFYLGLMTQPDHALKWFCRGIGFVRTEYHHHGTIDNQYWELYRMPDP